MIWPGPWERRPERMFLRSRWTRKRRRSRNESEPDRPRAYLGGSKSMSLQVAEEWAVSSADVFDVAGEGVVGIGIARAARSSQAIARSLADSPSRFWSYTPRATATPSTTPTTTPSTTSSTTPSTIPSTTPRTAPRARPNTRHPVSSLSERAHRPLVPNESIPPYAIFSSRSFRHWRVSL